MITRDAWTDGQTDRPITECLRRLITEGSIKRPTKPLIGKFRQCVLITMLHDLKQALPKLTDSLVGLFTV